MVLKGGQIQIEFNEGGDAEAAMAMRIVGLSGTLDERLKGQIAGRVPGETPRRLWIDVAASAGGLPSLAVRFDPDLAVALPKRLQRLLPAKEVTVAEVSWSSSEGAVLRGVGLALETTSLTAESVRVSSGGAVDLAGLEVPASLLRRHAPMSAWLASGALRVERVQWESRKRHHRGERRLWTASGLTVQWPDGRSVLHIQRAILAIAQVGDGVTGGQDIDLHVVAPELALHRP